MMTVGGWILFGFVALCTAAGLMAVFFEASETRTKVIASTIGAVFLILWLIGMIWWFQNTASGQRKIKSQQSNFDRGLVRTVKVFDAIGNTLYEYDGKLDISYEDERILFDDENGKRHVIYFKSGTVIIEEK